MTRTDNFAWHEAFDRATLLTDTFSDFVADHPIVSADPELSKLAEAALDAMCKVYSAIGDKAPHMQPESLRT